MAGVVGSNPTRPTILSLSTARVMAGGAALQKTEAALQNWHEFHQFLLQRMTEKTAEDRLRYAKRYASVLQNYNVTLLLQLPPNKRIHIMKSLSCLARYIGTQSDWLAIRQRYGLQWSIGTEKLDAFTRFFGDSKDLDTMIGWLKEAIQALPTKYANFFLFCTLTGMHCSEALESVKLIKKDPETFNRYYDPDGQVLRHYAFLNIFIRRTKAVYISIVDDEIIGITQDIEKVPTLNALRMVSVHH